ncbi:MAG: Kdo hydroxylase family protein [Legionellaceae bacterium]|nr:Kdo hydroxylase family protein [Legionellaceae bacterium]
MDDYLYCIKRPDIENTEEPEKNRIIPSLESGKIIYFPDYSFIPSENENVLLSESILHKRSKNISYNYQNNRLSGQVKSRDLNANLQKFMHRYAMYTKHLVDTLIPDYSSYLIWGRTSYRPAQVKGRISSKRKDDTRIHVDAFPSTPVKGLRIFRIFCNVNPYGEPRKWQVGEPFSNVLQTFARNLPKYSNTKANLLNLVGATKSKRSAYDHYMLHMHDSMKLDDQYQKNLNKETFDFPPNSTWMVFTDQVSHAALGGQFLLEQTFYLPVEHMHNPDLSPLKQLEATGMV